MVKIVIDSLLVTYFIFLLQSLVEVINLSFLTKEAIVKFLNKNKYLQYILIPFLGATPGCVGAFISASLYQEGVISFGAINGCMIATSGDEAFLMLALFPQKALIIFFILFLLGVIFSFLIDKLNITTKKCALQFEHSICQVFDIKNYLKIRLVIIFSIITIISYCFFYLPKNNEFITFFILSLIILPIISLLSKHFLKTHIINHIIKGHLWKIFFWSFFAIFLAEKIVSNESLQLFIEENMNLIFLISAIMGILPTSGPHLIFTTLFYKGIIPISILITNSIIQDGHGMLPIFAFSIKDAILIKLFNFLIGISIGYLLYGVIGI